MNAPSLHDLRLSAQRDAQDEKMDQIRQLLLGDSLKELSAHVASLEARIVDLEVGLARQLDAIEMRIDQMSGAAQGEQRAAFAALAGSVAELGERIRRISKGE